MYLKMCDVCDTLAWKDGKMAVQEGVVGDGIKHKHLALLCAQPHGVINSTDASDASTAHRKELCGGEGGKSTHPYITYSIMSPSSPPPHPFPPSLFTHYLSREVGFSSEADDTHLRSFPLSSFLQRVQTQPKVLLKNRVGRWEGGRERGRREGGR